jgi:hypothetical protein
MIELCSTCGGRGVVDCLAHIQGDGCDHLLSRCPDCPAPALLIDGQVLWDGSVVLDDLGGVWQLSLLRIHKRGGQLHDTWQWYPFGDDPEDLDSDVIHHPVQLIWAPYHKTAAIRGVWLTKSFAHLGNQLQVLVEDAHGQYRLIIDERADDGPISHYVHPAGIAAAPTIPRGQL